MKKFVFAATVALALSSVAGAQKYIGSPAQDLFDQASFLLDTQYFGPSTKNVAELVQKYQAEVDKACETLQDKCTFKEAERPIALMLNDLEDGHAYYLPPAERTAEINNQTSSLRVGITSRGFCDTPTGACLSTSDKLLSDRLITNVVPNGPAYKAGVRYGDRWIGFNGKLFSEFPTPDELTRYVGDFGTKIRAGESVNMILLRGSGKTRIEVALKGETLTASPLPWMEIRDDGVAVIHHRDFGIGGVNGIGQRVHTLVKEANEKQVKGIILDMRNNGGGSPFETWFTAAAFSDKLQEVKALTRYNADKNSYLEGFSNGKYYRKTLSGQDIGSFPLQTPALYSGPMTILVDGNCASACEFSTSFLQRIGRPKAVIGEKTYGIGNTNSRRWGLVNGGAASMPFNQYVWTDNTPLPSFVTPMVQTPNFEFVLFNQGIDQPMQKALDVLQGKTVLSLQKSLETSPIINSSLLLPIQFSLNALSKL